MIIVFIIFAAIINIFSVFSLRSSGPVASDTAVDTKEEAAKDLITGKEFGPGVGNKPMPSDFFFY